jgi:hypothetical protein
MLVGFDLLEAHAQTNLLSVASDYDQNKRKLIFVLALMWGHYPDKARDCVFGVPFAVFSLQFRLIARFPFSPIST